MKILLVGDCLFDGVYPTDLERHEGDTDYRHFLILSKCFDSITGKDKHNTVSERDSTGTQNQVTRLPMLHELKKSLHSSYDTDLQKVLELKSSKHGQKIKHDVIIGEGSTMSAKWTIPLKGAVSLFRKFLP